MARDKLQSQPAVGALDDPYSRADGQQFGALCYRINRHTNSVEFLLITTRETRRWTIPKGWPMGDLQPHRVAQQEAYEEAGVRGKVSRTAIGSFTYNKRLPTGGQQRCVVEVYDLKVQRMVQDFKERGQREIVWLSLGDALAMVAEPELKGLFRAIAIRARTKLLRRVGIARGKAQGRTGGRIGRG
jgi:8-oxo-dGTP pyrophosphatase MutT (NUDIX family)